MNRAVSLSLFALLLTMLSPTPSLAAEAVPGDACAVAGIRIFTGGPEISGGHMMVCDGANWVSVIEYEDSGQSLLQYGYDSGPCTAAKDGRVRYNSGGSPPWNYCDGGTTSWLPFDEPQCQDDDTGECYLEATRSNDDPDFIAANIKSGVNILGVTGTASGGGGGPELWEEVSTFSSSPLESFSGFGIDADIDGNVAVIGRYLSDNGGFNQGDAFVFERMTDGSWSQQDRLLPSNPADTRYFGAKVAIDGNVIAVISYYAFYIFERNGSGVWTEVLTDAGPVTSPSDGDVSVDGDVIVVADPMHGSGNTGRVLVYERNSSGTWGLAQTLTPSDSATQWRFGNNGGAVVHGDTIIAAQRHGTYLWSSVYIFERNSSGTWIETQKIEPSDEPILKRNFGYGLAIEGDTAIVGRRSATSAIFVYERGSDGVWREIQIIPRPPGAANSYTTTMSLDGDTLATVGKYVYRRGSDGLFHYVEELANGGYGVAAGGDTILSIDNADNGTAYVYYKK